MAWRSSLRVTMHHTVRAARRTPSAWGLVRSCSAAGLRTFHTSVRPKPSWAGLGLASVLFATGATAAVVTASAEKDLPTYPKSEIAKHNSAKSCWIVVGDGVYDMTEFIEGHPGGKEKILLAAGSNVEPYWNIYRQHYKDQVSEILQDYKIGNTIASEWVVEKSASDIVNDPYASDPERSPLMHFHSKTPCNAEPPPELVASSFITPNDLFFVRNHSPVPVLDEDTYRLVIKGRKGQEDRTFTLTQLKEGFKRIEMISSIQCGGNRRYSLNEVMGKPQCMGTSWDNGAISTAKWAGVSLREVLDFCGHSHSYCREKEIEHVVFEGVDGVTASIPIQKALCPGECVLLAYEMNGEPLPRDHGYPLRAVVPGHVGVRNVKWLGKIECSQEEAFGPWQRGIAYKGFSPSQTNVTGIDVEKLVSLQEMPVQSAITMPIDGRKVAIDTEDNTIPVRGYAWSGGGRGVIRVDVSADGGQTWHNAELGEGHDQPLDRAWAWTLWNLDLPMPPHVVPGAKVEIMCRATDASYNVQPESTKSIWNLRGIANNSSHRIVVPTEK